jgi:hypothetical protein
VLQRYLPLYSQPMIYFGSTSPAEGENLEDYADPSILHFEINSGYPIRPDIGLFFHWYDLSDSF